jgi:hypothetical protein
MLTADDKKIAWKFGLLLASLHLAFSLFIWIRVALCSGGNREGWFYVAILHLPSIWLAEWLFPRAADVLLSLPEPLVLGGLGTTLWFLLGWTTMRVVTLYG